VSARAATAAFGLACALAWAAPAALRAQQPDTASTVRRALERFDRNATVRVHYNGRTATGQVTRLTADSVYVRGLDWPAAVPLVHLDTVWVRIRGGDRWKGPALVGAVVGGALTGLAGAGLCGESEIDHRCLVPVMVSAAVGAALFGGVTAFVAGLISLPARWERRFP
jgi:hypothetical protein